MATGTSPSASTSLPAEPAGPSSQGFVGYPGDGANLWNAVHVRDVASLFRLALEKGPAGKYWHAVGDGASRSAKSPRPWEAVWACPS
ncbi:hypothetical protein FRACA_920017 [Frankia canadensis]|uniref:NAD-dependent epimerase/dehydratase domain-containing protein n=1 Tax=Frankia canadensis TaxID=1836972 RepID=A0A2I2L2H9_9ACTN|nr:hypothetical protein FRACA_920017 [Frankia canadensis]SOU59414.1 hypothetical protein FRACA_920017 [Frankia canadensis]